MRVFSVPPFPRDPSCGHYPPGFYGQRRDTLYHRLDRYRAAADVRVNTAARDRLVAAYRAASPDGFPVVVLGLPGVAVCHGENAVPDYHALGWPLAPDECPS